jgi:hypothetical protein
VQRADIFTPKDVRLGFAVFGHPLAHERVLALPDGFAQVAGHRAPSFMPFCR